MSTEGHSTQDKSLPNWEAIERDYRVGVRAVTAIAQEHGITEGAIRKRAKRDGWVRDLNAKVRAKADELVRKAEVRTQGTRRPATDREPPDRGRYEHPEGCEAVPARRHQALPCAVHEAADRAGEADGPGSRAAGAGRDPALPGRQGQDKLNDIYQAVISLPERTKTMKALAWSKAAHPGVAGARSLWYRRPPRCGR